MKKINSGLKQTLKQFKDELGEHFCQKATVTALTYKLVNYIDGMLLTFFQKNQLHHDNQFCLLALGGYGRRELQLYSDVDLLLLHSDNISPTLLQRAQLFIQDCWDGGLEISHQITTPNACAELASQDLSVISSLLDMHLLCGRRSLMEELLYLIHPSQMWPSYHYFIAKQDEQARRYSKYGETAYNLEPNVKQGPGGLRDIHVLQLVSKRHFGIKKLAEGIAWHFITEREYEELRLNQHFLWRVRFALHCFAGKNEDRLLFDYQIKLAHLFGFTDNDTSLAIEQFMKTYFNAIKRSRELNEMLLQWLAETMLEPKAKLIQSADAAFLLRGQYIEAKHPEVFIKNPINLIKLFVLISKYPTIQGVTANTLRLIRQSFYLFNKQFLNQQEVTQSFLAVFREGHDPYQALHYMHKYGVLNQYLDCFAAITGQMQYDLFHVYTVDQHTLFVIRNLVRFLDNDYSQQFPLACSLMPTVQKREILYLAALFHDIAKGRGGDHSDLGANEAGAFAKQHAIEEADEQLLVWLVRHHLLMSQTAQRQDIYDINTIERFSQVLPSPHYLDYLYLLTIADICATNPNLWNSWKDSLLKELYHATKRLFEQQKNRLNEKALSEQRKQQALALLSQNNICCKEAETLWRQFKDKYFIHESPEIIATHTKAILTCKEYPLVMMLPHHNQGGTEVFIYMPHCNERFTITTSILSNYHATIQEAAILTCDNQFDLDTYIILNEHHQAFFSEHSTKLIENALKKALAEPTRIPVLVKRRPSRLHHHFKIKTTVFFSEDGESQYTCLFLVTNDRAGLLANLSHVFAEHDLYLHNAKISTAGERVEDTFYISTLDGLPLDDATKTVVREHLLKKLSS